VKTRLFGIVFLCVIISVAGIVVPETSVSADTGTVVNFPDHNLATAIRSAINKPAGNILESDLINLTSLAASNDEISDLTGLQYCVNLSSLDLDSNQIDSVSPLSGLSNLEMLRLCYNQIRDVSPLANLTSLQYLGIGNNPLTDISVVSKLTNITGLDISFCPINNVSAISHLAKLQNLQLQGYQLPDTNSADKSILSSLSGLASLNLYDTQLHDISFLTDLTNLSYINLGANAINDLSPLTFLTKIQNLCLSINQINDLSPLVANRGLTTGETIDLTYNCLNISAGSQNTKDIGTLVNQGVIVNYLPQQYSLTTTSLISSINPMVSGQIVTFTASLNPAPDGGTIQFECNGSLLGSPVTVISGQASYATSALAAGIFAITALYQGDANFAPSMSFLNQTVNTAFDTLASLRISGSTTSFPLMKGMLGIPSVGGLGTGGTFQQNTLVTWNADVEQGDDVVGINDCASGDNDIGLSSTLTSALTSQLSGTSVTYKEFARDGICIIANSGVTGLSNLTLNQVARIFGTVPNQSAITTWSSLGATSTGADNIVAIGREFSSGERDTLDGALAGTFPGWTDTSVNPAYRENSDGALITAVSNTKGAIAYVSFGYLMQDQAGVTIFNISKDTTYPVPSPSNLFYVTPSALSITSGSYPIVTTLKFLTNTIGSANSANANTFINYMLSRLGQDDTANVGFIKLNPDEDVNGDGKINVSDIALMGTKWLQKGSPGWCPEDINQDGKVNISDIALIGQWWLMSYPRINN
jgi:ABC-type phosphate transport system substrate-binding protein